MKASAYISGEERPIGRDGEYITAPRSKRVCAHGVELPEGAPVEFFNASRLWLAAEAAHRGGNGLVARRIMVALPCELDEQQNVAAIVDLCRLYTTQGHAVEWAMHAPTTEDSKNWHAFLLVSALKVGPDGFVRPTTKKTEKSYLVKDPTGASSWCVASEWKAAKARGYEKVFHFTDGKDRSMSEAMAAGLTKADRVSKTPIARTFKAGTSERADEAGKASIKAERAAWAGICNKYLAAAGVDARVDHRSNKERGLDVEPMRHEGPRVTAIERRAERAASELGVAYRPRTAERRANDEIRERNVAIERVTAVIRESERKIAELEGRDER